MRRVFRFLGCLCGLAAAKQNHWNMILGARFAIGNTDPPTLYSHQARGSRWSPAQQLTAVRTCSSWDACRYSSWGLRVTVRYLDSPWQHVRVNDEPVSADVHYTGWDPSMSRHHLQLAWLWLSARLAYLYLGQDKQLLAVVKQDCGAMTVQEEGSNLCLTADHNYKAHRTAGKFLLMVWGSWCASGKDSQHALVSTYTLKPWNSQLPSP